MHLWRVYLTTLLLANDGWVCMVVLANEERVLCSHFTKARREWCRGCGRWRRPRMLRDDVFATPLLCSYTVIDRPHSACCCYLLDIQDAAQASGFSCGEL